MSGEKKTEGGSSSNPIDHNSPYYLHPSDVPKQLHVNDILTDSNYADWAQEMQNFLFAKNKIEFVDGTLAKPEKGTPEYMPWMRCDAMVKGWLATAMEKRYRIVSNILRLPHRCGRICMRDLEKKAHQGRTN